MEISRTDAIAEEEEVHDTIHVVQRRPAEEMTGVRIQELATPEETTSVEKTSAERPRKRQRTQGYVPPEKTRYERRLRQPPPWQRTLALLTETLEEEPLTFEEAINSSESHLWWDAIKEELRSLKDNNVYTVVDDARGRASSTTHAHPIASKWVFKKKLLANDKIRYKARLVVRGDLQNDDVETFAPVAKMTTVRALVAVATARNLEIEQLDVKTAFLYAKLKETVFMKAPKGYGSNDESDGKIWCLNRALYGLKQAPRAWNEEINSALKRLGYTKTSSDASLYRKNSIYLLMYVDDLLLVGERQAVDKAKKELVKLYKMTDLGAAKRFLGISIDRNRATKEVTLHQSSYIEGLLRRYEHDNCNPVSTPMIPGTKLSRKDDESKSLIGKEISWYKQLVGSLMYIMIATRPDLAFTMSRLSKFFDSPTEEHATAAKRVLRYLKGTTGKGIIYTPSTKKSFAGYSDSDFAGDSDDRKSTGGYVFLLFGGAISWKSKKQALPALSTVEAEYIAGAEATKEAIWLLRLLRDLDANVHNAPPATIHFDNQGAMALTKNDANHNRTKHIDVKWHFIRAYVDNGTIKITYLPTANMVADILTKALPRERHWQHANSMGM
jgi:hypothetical protein